MSMDLDMQQVQIFREKIRQTITTLQDNKELFDEELIYDAETAERQFNEAVALAEDDTRKLRIGIVGEVKAGKSSFLNACLFNGQDLLPKACTPMTAALTVISHSDQPKAIVHFYTNEDWARISTMAEDYSKRLDDEYADYLEKQSKPKGITAPPAKLQSKEEFIRRKRSMETGASQGPSCLELMEKVRDNPNVISYLGEDVTIDLPDMAALNPYIGAKGEYTPIVNYVELQMNMIPEGIEIVDTPGLNDPVVSRSKKTKEFLAKCDVVLLLSTCSHFMNANTFSLMTDSFPNEGIKRLVVIGSKLDNGIVEYPREGESFDTARKASQASYRKQFTMNLDSIRRDNPSNPYLRQLSETESVIFVSSYFYGIAQKRKANVPLNPGEENIWQLLHTRFTGVPDDPDKFMELSGIPKVHKIFNSVLADKERIFAERNQDLFNDYQIKLSRILQQVSDSAENRRKNLQDGNIRELQEKHRQIQRVLDSTRISLMGIFEQAANQCTKNVQKIESRIRTASAQYSTFRTDVKTEQQEHMYKDGLFNLRKNYYTTTTTTYVADTAQIINNIANYIAACKGIILEEFDHLVNTEALNRTLIEIVLEAFNSSSEDFSENDILIPLNTVLSRISIPMFSIDENKYIDAIRSEFSSGFVQNDEIHKLSAKQAELFIEVGRFINDELRKCADEITQILKTQAVTFADEIAGKISTDCRNLEEQLQDKERYLQKYAAFAESITACRQNLNTMQKPDTAEE